VKIIKEISYMVIGTALAAAVFFGGRAMGIW
jgi:hypothetical protein